MTNAALMERLRKIAKEKPLKPYLMVIIGDFGKDTDDERVLLIARALEKLGYVKVLCVVANLAVAEDRARLAKGTLIQAGSNSIPVGIGQPVLRSNIVNPYETAMVSYLAETGQLAGDGLMVLTSALKRCDEESVILVLQSAMTDANLIPDNLLSKIETVAIMGGVATGPDGMIDLSLGQIMVDSSNNYTFDLPAAKAVLAKFQAMRIPIIFTSRFAAYVTKMTLESDSDLVATGNPVGLSLKTRIVHMMQKMWFDANLPAEDPRRGTFPPRCNRQWFVDTFCGSKDPEISPEGDILPFILGYSPYDPCNFLAAIPEFRGKYLEPIEVVVDGVTHKVIGMNAKLDGVGDEEGFSQLIMDLQTYGLM